MSKKGDKGVWFVSWNNNWTYRSVSADNSPRCYAPIPDPRPDLLWPKKPPVWEEPETLSKETVINYLQEELAKIGSFNNTDKPDPLYVLYTKICSGLFDAK